MQSIIVAHLPASVARFDGLSLRVFIPSSYLISMYKTTLDQWLVFKTVAEQKGFSAAAKVLNRSQSTVSYSIAKLQDQLGLQLIDVQGRSCELTLAGRNLLSQAKTVLAAAEELELTANYLSAGVESNLLLAVDSIFPKPVLFSAISRFSEHFPHTQIDIEESFRLMPDDDATCDLSITVSQGGITPGPKLIDVTVVPVAHHQHPIFSNREGEISKEELKCFKQIFYQSFQKQDIDQLANVPHHIWSVQSMSSAIAAIDANLCYGWLPKHHVATYLDSGRFKQIPIKDMPPSLISLYLVDNTVGHKGPALQYFRQMLVEACSPPLDII